jgi:hypothetical protein
LWMMLLLILIQMVFCTKKNWSIWRKFNIYKRTIQNR